jgi:capsular exopolysaccharide synthesis family protein
VAITDKQIKEILQQPAVNGIQNLVGIAIIDLSGTVRFANFLWSIMHGHSTTDELFGKPFSIFHTKEQMETDVTPLMEEVKFRGKIEGPIEHVRSDGVIFSTQTKMVSVKDEQGNIIALAVFARGSEQNNFSHRFTNQGIEPITIATDNFQEQTIEQKVSENSQYPEVTADIEAEHAIQPASIEPEAKQAVNIQDTIADEAEQYTAGGKSETEQVLAEADIRAGEDKKTHNEITANTEVEIAEKRTEPKVEPEETAINIEKIEQIQPESESYQTLRDEVEEGNIDQTGNNNLNEKPAETKENIRGSRITKGCAEEMAELKAKRQEIGKSGIYELYRQVQVKQDLSETTANERPNETSLRDVCCVFFRHKWKMALFFFVVIVIGAIFTLIRPDYYRSEAKLLVRLGHESVTLDPTAATGMILPVSQSRENEVNSELEILKSRELIEKVVDYVGAQEILSHPESKSSAENAGVNTVERTRLVLRTSVSKFKNILKKLTFVEPLSDRDAATLEIAKNLSIENLKDSSIISISYIAESPKLAQEVVSKLIDLHLEKHVSVYRTPGSHQFFDQQVKQLRDELLQSENQLRDYKNDTGVSSVTEQQQVILNRIGSLRQDIDQTDAALASSVALVEALQQTLAEVPEIVVTEKTTGFPNLSADEMRKQLFERQLEELKLRTSFTEESGIVKAIREEIDNAQELLSRQEPNRTQITRGLSKTYEELQSALFSEQAAISSLQAKINTQRQQLADAQAELKILNDAEAKIKLLTREADIQEINYRKYSESLEQARINDAMEGERISNISVVQAATFPIKAIGQNKLVYLALIFALGVIGAIIIAIFSEHLDHSIKTPQEAEARLHLPTLASIPRVRFGKVFPSINSKIHSRTKGKTSKKEPVSLEIPAKIRESYEAFMEQIIIRSNGTIGTPYALAVIGCQRNDGVSTVVANLAVTISKRNKNAKVLLMDANLSHPYIHRVFNTRLAPGLADILSNGQKSEDVIQSLPERNVHILTAGVQNGDTYEILDFEGFTKLLDSVKERYRFVVIDIPALNEVSMATRLAGLCDGAILVVEAERSRREVMQKAKVQLVESNANILGVVLNKRRFHIPDWLYRRL